MTSRLLITSSRVAAVVCAAPIFLTRTYDRIFERIWLRGQEIDK
jgi:hypothetical protein